MIFDYPIALRWIANGVKAGGKPSGLKYFVLACLEQDPINDSQRF
jgi:hypothetical protein|tara:strand:+ start:5872 stop:6006 length:135 start_codon:yes stop_codon:yes gene_type:complete